MRPSIIHVGGTLYWTIQTRDPDTFVLKDADSTPTVVVRKNGSSVADSVTITKRSATTGLYDCSYNPAGEVEGDTFQLEESAAVTGTTTSSATYVNQFSVRVSAVERGTDGALQPTSPGRTLDVSTGGEAGIDWSNVGSPTTTLNLSGTTVATTQKVDIETIKTRTITAGSNITVGAYVGGTAECAVASTALSTATWTGTLATNLTTTNTTVASNLDATISSRLASSSYTAPPSASTNATAVRSELTTELGRIDAAISSRLSTLGTNAPSGWINGAAIASSAITAAKIATGALTAVKFGSDAFDAVWTVTNRTITNATVVRTELATELARIDADISTRLASASYTSPPSASTISTQIASDLATAHGAGSWATATGFSTHSASDVWAVGTRTITGGDLTTSPPTVSAIADEVQTRTIARVTLVDTTTTNSDMRGTDSALTSIGANAPAGWLNAAAFSGDAFDAVWAVGTRGLTEVVNLDSSVRVKLDVDQPDYAPLKMSDYIEPPTAVDNTNALLSKLKNTYFAGTQQYVIWTMNEDGDKISTANAVGNLPTSTELSTALAAADDAVLAAINALNNLSAAQVNAEVLDVLSIDTFAELSSPPNASSSLKDKLTWLFMWTKNKATQTNSERKLYADDDITVISVESVTDNNNIFTKDKAS
jgi:hypothetical protein